MKKRIITGLIGAFLFAFVLWLGKEFYSMALFGFALIAYLEFCKMKDFVWFKPEGIIGLLMLILIFGTGLADTGVIPHYHILQSPFNILLPFILFSLWILISNNVFHLYRMGYLFVGTIYIGYGFMFMMKTMWGQEGLYLTLLMILITWANDSSAYFIGRKWGRRKLWPHISPNKTLEGSLGGLVAGVLMSIVVCLLYPQLGTLFKALWLGLFIAVIGQLGDLLESAWKRTVGIKDSGHILPGHGGFLDRFDSLLFSFIVLYTFGLLG